jgi:hypothetical protein
MDEIFLEAPFWRRISRSKLQRKVIFTPLYQRFNYLSWSDPSPIAQVTILPVCPLPILPLIEFLASPCCNQLNGTRDYVSFPIVFYEEVDVVVRHHIVERAQTEALLSFEKPLQISALVSSKF